MCNPRFPPGCTCTFLLPFKAEAEKTEEQRYSEEQDAIDRETQKKLREKAQEEKMQQLPSDNAAPEPKVHDIRLGCPFLPLFCLRRGILCLLPFRGFFGLFRRLLLLRDVIADMMQASGTKIAQIESINNRLIPEFTKELKEGHGAYVTAIFSSSPSARISCASFSTSCTL